MSTRAYTATELGATYPHLIARTFDGDRHIVHEILGYGTAWCNVSTGEQSRTVTYTYRAPGVLEPITGRITPDRLTIVGWCDGCPFRGCSGCRFQGGTGPAKRANSPVVWENTGSSTSVPAPLAGGRGLGRTGLESDAMSVASPSPARHQNRPGR